MTKHKHIGLIEYKNIDSKPYTIFLIDIDINSKKIFATYGPFDKYIDATDHAAFIGLEID
jgi:hypothetical protein